MPFQSEKQRRYLHANHPEIAKRWEEEYATGGIANHFRKKFKKGSYSRSYNPGAGGVVQHGPVKTKTTNNGGGGGDGPPSVVHKPTGPTAAEIAAAKAAAAAKKKAIADAKHKDWITKKTKEKKKKVKHHSNIRPFGFTEYEKLIKPGLYDHYKKNLPSYDSEGVELRTDRVIDNLHLLTDIRKGGIKGNVNENISPFGQTFQTFDYKYDPYKPTSENFWEGHNTLVTPAGLNQAQTNYLDKVAKKGVVKESGQFFTYDKPTDVRAKLKELDEKSEKWIGTDVNPDKIVSGDPTTYATDKDVKEYLQKKYPGMQLKDDSGRTLAIDLATGGIANHFKFKDGGTPRQRFWWGGNPNEDRAAEESHANEFAGIDSGGWDPGVSSPGTTSSGGNVNTGGGDQEDDVAQMMHDMSLTPDHSPDWTGSDRGWVESEDEETEIGGADYIGPQDSVRIHDAILDKHAHRFKPIKDLTWEQRARLAKETWDAWNTGKSILGIFSGPIGAVLGGKALLDANKQKKETIAELKADIKTLTDLGYPTHHHTVDTLIQSLNQEILDMTQPKSKDEDTGGDGPPTPLVVPEVMDEMADATGQIDMFDAWERIKRNQAIYAARQSADDTKVGEWVGDQRLLVNSGGLANLFRVKNRN